MIRGGVSILVLAAGAALAASVFVVHEGMAQSGPSLPIAKGAWVDQYNQCGSTGQVYVYDGTRWGNIYYFENPQMGREPQAELHRITKATRLRSGFTEFTTTVSLGGTAFERVKSLGPNRATYQMGAPARDRVEVDELTLTLCSPASLSQRMQAAVRRFAPAAWTGAAATAAAPVPAARPAPAPQSAGAGNWRALHDQTGSFAALPRTGKIRNILLACNADGNVLMIMDVPTVSRGTSMNVRFNNQFDTRFSLAPAEKLWASTLSSEMLGIMMYADTSSISSPVIPAETVTLDGSSKAFREGLGACLFDPGAGMPAPVGPLGIAPGHYVNEGTLCTDAPHYFYYDGRRHGMITRGTTNPETALAPVGTPRRTGQVWRTASGIVIEPKGAGRIAYNEEANRNVGVPMRWCAPAHVPSTVKPR